MLGLTIPLPTFLIRSNWSKTMPSYKRAMPPWSKTTMRSRQTRAQIDQAQIFRSNSEKTQRLKNLINRHRKTHQTRRAESQNEVNLDNRWTWPVGQPSRIRRTDCQWHKTSWFLLEVISTMSLKTRSLHRRLPTKKWFCGSSSSKAKTRRGKPSYKNFRSKARECQKAEATSEN